MNDLGVNFKFYRPPWGHCNIFTSREIKKHNLKKVLWDVMAQDWQGNTTVEAITDKLLLRSKENSIIISLWKDKEEKYEIRKICCCFSSN